MIGIRASGRWTGERLKHDGEETYLVEQCDSPLAMRIALREDSGEAIKVLITELEDRDLGEDVLMRLARRRLIPIDRWQIVKSLLRATSIDPRIGRQNWIADLLMELVGRGAVPTGSRRVSRRGAGLVDSAGALLGLAGDRPDLLAVLKWLIDEGNVRRFHAALPEFRQAAAEWLADAAGPAALIVLECVAGNRRPDALPIGLAAGVIFHPGASPASWRRRPAGSKSRYLGGRSPEPAALAR